jgi:hypothetical protein
MSLHRRVLSLVFVLGLLLSLPLLGSQGTALAQPESEEITVKNPLIDCSTNPAYDNRYIAAAFKSGGGHVGGSNRQCNACHQNANPQFGDKPRATLATALIQNRLKEEITYSTRMGKKGEWEKVELKPGAVQRHSFRYKKANANRSPEFFVKFEGTKGEEVERKLGLVATPNEKLGAVYFFERDEKDNQVYLWRPGPKINRPL